MGTLSATQLGRGAVRQGLRFLRAELPIILASRSDGLSPRMMRIIEELTGDAATIALEMIGPMPGTVISRSQAGS